MVLQRNRPILFFGKASAGAIVRVALNSHHSLTTVLSDESWQVELPPLSAGGPFESCIECGDEQVILRDLLIGDLWLCSGQSNMGRTLNMAQGGDLEASQANEPMLRLASVPASPSPQPCDESEVIWKASSPETVPDFSAVGYFFGREIHRETGIPIGLIQCTVGGTPAEAWMPMETLQSNPSFKSLLEFRHENEVHDETREQETALLLKAWLEELKELFKSAPDRVSMRSPVEVASGASRGPWGGAIGDDFVGAAWCRTTVTISAKPSGGRFILRLDPLESSHAVYFNGERIGSQEVQGGSLDRDPFVYSVPDALVKVGENLLEIRLILRYDIVFPVGNRSGCLSWGEASTDCIPLNRDWIFEVEKRLGRKPKRDGLPKSRASYLYNGMVHPLIPFPIRGVIWYQGEANAVRWKQYRDLFPALIRSWRALWNQGDFPFYFVQLANYHQRPVEPGESNWAGLREAQTMALSEPNTGMAVAIDLGESDNIHPGNKRDVGLRLARIALARDYVRETQSARPEFAPLMESGPVFRSMKREGSALRIYFDSVGSGFEFRGEDPVRGFAVAGSDRRFYWAEAVIENETVVISHSQVPDPMAVRYAWADNPPAALYNREGLPAVPFRTDDWS